MNKQENTRNGLVGDINNLDSGENGQAPFLKVFNNTRQNDVNSIDVVKLTGNKQETPLSSLFFSSLNIKALQEGLRYSVFMKSNKQYVIPEQPVNELIMIMRYIYPQHSKNLPYHIVEQVRELNKIVLDYAVPRTMKAKESYDMYVRDASMLNTPIDLSINTSSKGEKTLEFKGF